MGGVGSDGDTQSNFNADQAALSRRALSAGAPVCQPEQLVREPASSPAYRTHSLDLQQ